MEAKKRTRRNKEKVITGMVDEIYVAIEKMIKESDDKRVAIEEIFEAFHPIRSMEDQYRLKNDTK